jgi:hypothetical protein
VPAGIDEPGARIGGQAELRPAQQGCLEGILRTFFGQFKIANEADEGGQHPSRLVAIDGFDCATIE